MKIEPKRVKKIPSPLLIIGLGGTGSDALLTIMDKFNRRYELPVTSDGDVLDTPERTAYLAFDSDPLELQSKKKGNVKFSSSNIYSLTMPSAIGTGVQPSYIKSWMNKSLNGFKILNGAGGNRQAGRYVFFHHADSIYNKLKSVIHSLLATPAGNIMGTLEIVLTAGISGGTGSGTFLDMAYMVRHVMRTDFPAVNYKFMSYIMTPPVNVAKIAAIDPGKKNMLEATGFAALKELDFWMNYDTHKYEYTQRYSDTIEIKWNVQPFDYVVLMGDKTVEGDIIVDSYNNCLDVLSESVVNFFAHEQAGIGGQSTLRSHLINVTNQEPFLAKAYPANYTYMTVGAAISDSQQEEMVTYESKLVFDRIENLRKIATPSSSGSRCATALLGKREGEQFIDTFLPADKNYFADFSGVMTDLDIFSTWTPAVAYNSPPIHVGSGSFYEVWCYDCAQEAEKFAVECVKQLRIRFYEMVERYATDLIYGPFVLADFLKDPNKGFLHFFSEMTENWSVKEHNILNERNNTLAEIDAVQYKEMLAVAKLFQSVYTTPARNYLDRCYALFNAARDYELAKVMARECRALLQEIKAYVETVLPTFCNLLLQVGEKTDLAMKEIDLEADSGAIASSAQLKSYITKVFGDPQQDELAKQVITRMIKLSQRIELDNMGTIVGLADMREQFVAAADRFVMDATTLINGMNMDQLITIKLPDSTLADKIDYVANHVLDHLDKAARTMLPLTETDKMGNHFIPYAYVSVPQDVSIIQEGVKKYQETNKLTPKYSDVSDMIFWLNTYNCVPMCMYTDLPLLEKVYDEALAKNGVNALHLVQTTSESGDHTLRYDWSLFPSPVVHKLQNLEMPNVIVRRQKNISDMLEQALNNGAATLTEVNGQERLRLRLRMENGVVETMDQFERKLAAITEEKNTIPEQKIAQLKQLMREGVEISREYKSFTAAFADAENLRLDVDSHTDAELKLVADNKEKARRMAAAYILYAWYPQIAEQMITQQEMFRKLNEAIVAQEVIMNGQASLQAFVAKFLLLHLSDVFTVGRTGIKYKDFRGEEIDLVSKADFTDDELTIYSEFGSHLALLAVLGNEADSRINEHDRKYLQDKGAELAKSIDVLSDEEYAELQKKARAFYDETAQTSDAIRYYRGELAKPMRDQVIDLVEKLRKEAKKLYA